MAGDADLRKRELNGNACYRAGRATYELGEYHEALKHFNAVKAWVEGDLDADREVKRTTKR